MPTALRGHARRLVEALVAPSGEAAACARKAVGMEPEFALSRIETTTPPTEFLDSLAQSVGFTNDYFAKKNASAVLRNSQSLSSAFRKSRRRRIKSTLA